MDKKKIKNLIQGKLAEIENAPKKFTELFIVEPFSELRYYSDIKREKVWIFAKISEKNVAFAYSEMGYDGNGLHWGLLVLNGLTMGDSGAWYRTLAELLDDCCYF